MRGDFESAYVGQFLYRIVFFIRSHYFLVIGKVEFAFNAPSGTTTQTPKGSPPRASTCMGAADPSAGRGRDAANSTTQAAVSATFNAGDIPGTPVTIAEAGIFIDGTGTLNSGTLFSHLPLNVTVQSTDSLFIDWRITLASA